MHPTVPQIMMLWQAFLNNFDPLVKLFHAPTAQVAVSNAATDLDGIAPNTEALMFAIYLSATATLTEQQCMQLLGISKPVLLKRFANATQQALVNARFLKSTDPIILQALTLYLVRAPKCCTSRLKLTCFPPNF
ncbi:fungal specific transcription factor domain-containing protein [Candidatus Bathyarchaeota archaeon]|nr:fungal specific transcription factor domain-containing protein [Candidatus Bathyarchaeota archaeon]